MKKKVNWYLVFKIADSCLFVFAIVASFVWTPKFMFLMIPYGFFGFCIAAASDGGGSSCGGFHLE